MDLLITLFITSLLCAPCACYQYFAVQQGLDEIPSSVPDNVTTIDLQQNDIEEIPDNAFAGYLDLEKVYLKSNDISVVSSSAFCNGLIYYITIMANKLTEFPDVTCLNNRLKSLLLGNNKIKHIPQNRLSGFTKLNLLSLELNPLESLPDFTFKTLSHVKIQGATRITDMSPYMSYLTKIKTFRFGGMYDMPDFRTFSVGQTKFQNLYIFCEYGLSLNNVPNDVFVTLDLLTDLIITECSFPTFDNTTKQRITLLNILRLSNDTFTGSDVEGYDNLIKLFVKDSQLVTLPDLSSSVAPLEDIDLSSNSLSGVLTQQDVLSLITPCNCLTSLDFKNNQFSSVHDLTQILCAKVPQLIIDLTGNPILCTCDMEWVKHLNSSCGKITLSCSVADIEPCPTTASEELTAAASTVELTTAASTVELTTAASTERQTTSYEVTTPYEHLTTTNHQTIITSNAPGSTSQEEESTIMTMLTTEASSNSIVSVSMISAWNGQDVLQPQQCVQTGYHSQPWISVHFRHKQHISGLRIQGWS